MHCAVLLLACAISLGCGRMGMAREKPVAPDADRPFVAIWLDDEGYGPPRAQPPRAKTSGTPAIPEAPYLRIAVWNDGRVLFAADPEKLSGELREGKISPERIAQLKKELIATEAFSLNNATYLVPDAGSLCMMLDLGGQTQILRWDENENPNYGININPRPHHLKFKQVWKAVNRLALAARPADSRQFTGTFQPAKSWYLRPAVQSR